MPFKKVAERKTSITYLCICNLEKMVQVNLFAGQGQRHRYREWTCGHEEGMNWKIGLTYIHYHV